MTMTQFVALPNSSCCNISLLVQQVCLLVAELRCLAVLNDKVKDVRVSSNCILLLIEFNM